MNDSPEQLLAKLEQATSSESTGALDAETAMLHESWVAFGKLVDARDAESKPPNTCPSTARHVGLPLRFMAALAASLLVAFAAWAILNRDSDSVELSPEIVAPSDLSGAASAISDVAKAPNSNEQGDALDEFAWEDSFDEQLATTSQAIRSAQADWSGSDRRYSVLLDQFEQFSDELSEGSL